MTLATIEFPNGTRIDLGENGRWTGDDEIVVAYANNFQREPGYRYNYVASLAEEIASKIGGKVVFAIQTRDSGPPGALF